MVKSPNRLVEAIRAGRLTVAQPLPSYLPLADGAFVVGRLSEGLRQAVADPAATEARVRVGQDRVEALHAPAVAARQWAEALAAVDQRVEEAASRSGTAGSWEGRRIAP